MNTLQRIYLENKKRLIEILDIEVYRDGKLMPHPFSVQDFYTHSHRARLRYHNYQIDYLEQYDKQIKK